MTLAHAHSLTACARVEDADLAVPAGRRKERASGIERQALDRVSVPAQDGLRRVSSREVPELDDVVPSGRREDVVGGRMEENVADTAG